MCCVACSVMVGVRWCIQLGGSAGASEVVPIFNYRHPFLLSILSSLCVFIAASPHVNTITNKCDRLWWTNVMFINNLVPADGSETGGCFYWAW